MKPAGRKGDVAICSNHHTVGPAIEAASNVLINQRLALRDRDNGMHHVASRKRWTAASGAPCVLINNRRAFRQGDAVHYHEERGVLSSGSPNVVIGDAGMECAPRAPATIVVGVFLNSMSLPGMRVTTSLGMSMHTNEDGVAVLENHPPGVVTVCVSGEEVWRFDLHGGERVRLRLSLSLLAGGCSFKHPSLIAR